MKKSKIVRIECASADDAENVRRAVELVDVRAFLSIVGALLPLSQRGRTRVMNFALDKLDEDQGKVTVESTDGRHSLEATGPLPVQ